MTKLLAVRGVALALVGFGLFAFSSESGAVGVKKYHGKPGLSARQKLINAQAVATTEFFGALAGVAYKCKLAEVDVTPIISFVGLNVNLKSREYVIAAKATGQTRLDELVTEASQIPSYICSRDEGANEQSYCQHALSMTEKLQGLQSPQEVILFAADQMDPESPNPKYLMSSEQAQSLKDLR